MVEYATFPRALALAEVGWSDQAARHFADFEQRLANQYARMDRVGIRYRIPQPQGMNDVMQVNQSRYRLQLGTPLPGAAIYYTLDGTLPDPTYSPRYTAPVDVDLPLEQKRSLRALVIAADGRRSGVYNATLQNRGLKPATSATGDKKGLSFAYYEGRFATLLEFEKSTSANPIKRGEAASFSLKDYEIGRAHV